MQLHPSVIEKLLRIYTNYGGYREEHRLREELQKVDLTSYTQKTGSQNTFLVLTDDIEQYLNKLNS